MAQKIKVAVLMGGKSSEHEISLLSGREVVKNLDSNKYQVFSITISRDGKNWQIENNSLKSTDSPAAGRTQKKNSKIKNIFGQDQLAIIRNQGIDVVFIAMHGPFGEDGTIQGFLDLIEVPYTGSRVLASALGMDKIYSRKLFTQVGLKTPNFIVIKRGQKTNNAFKNFKLPIFVKPNNQGSSVGISKARNNKELAKAIVGAHRYSDFALIEEFIDGIEVTAAIIGNEQPKALPLIEIVPKNEFFDYEAKYDERLTDEIVPARISKSLTNKVQATALVAYKALGCMGFGRVDMIIKDKDIFVLELNTIPGLTAVSLVPKAAKAAGISYPKLLDQLIGYSLE